MKKTTIYMRACSKFLIRFGTLIGICAIILVLGIRAPQFFTLENIFEVLKQGSPLALIAMAQTIVLIAGGFDMSGGALMQLTCNIAAGMILGGNNAAVTILVCIGIGLLTGWANGMLINGLKMPPFVATLGISLMLYGCSLAYNGGESLTFAYQPGFSFLGRGYIGPIPFLVVVTVVILLAVNLIMRNTKLGMHMYASGGNIVAAGIKGINNKRCMLIAFLMAGFLLGIAGPLQASYNFGASALGTGMDTLISALAAALLGSTFSKSGDLNVVGTTISAVFIAALSNGLIVNGVSNRIINGITGLVLIISVLPTVISKREIGQITIF